MLLRKSMNVWFVWGASCAMLFFAASAMAQVPHEWIYNGVLFDEGQLFNGSVSIGVDVFASAGDEVPLWTETHDSVDVVEGVFFLRLGATESTAGDLEPALFTGQTLWVGIVIDGEPLEHVGSRMVACAQAPTQARATGRNPACVIARILQAVSLPPSSHRTARHPQPVAPNRRAILPRSPARPQGRLAQDETRGSGVGPSAEVAR